MGRTKSVEAVWKKQRSLQGFEANSGSISALKTVWIYLLWFERKMPIFTLENCF